MVEIDKYFGFDILNKYKSKSNIYGFILYSDSHPFVKKVLRDMDFWEEFDIKSGKSWPIFAVRPLEAKREKTVGGGENGYISMMVKVSEETRYNNDALRFFNLKDSEKDLPSMVIFAIDENQNKILQRVFKIKGRTKDEVHYSILSIIESVASMEKCILENNSLEKIYNTYIYDEVNKSLDQLEFKECIRNNLPIVGSIASFINIIFRLLSSAK